MDMDLRHLLKRSPPTRAALSIFRQLRRARCGGMTVPAICWLLRKRFPPSTVAHGCVSLARMRAIVWTGGKTRTRQAGHAKVWRASRCGE